MYNKITKIIFSPTGGTKRVTDIFCNEFSENQIEIDITKNNDDYSSYTVDGEGITVISMPVFAGVVPSIALERLKSINSNNSNCIVIAVYGNRAYDNAIIQMKKVVTECGFNVIAAIGAVAEHSIFRQFATNRPDADDTIDLKDFAQKIKDKIDSKDFNSTFDVPGEKEFKIPGNMGMVPKGNNNCTNCGACAKACPVGAIDFTNPDIVDKDKCISCMACVAVCPVKARGLNSLFLKTGAMAMKSKFETRKSNDLFL